MLTLPDSRKAVEAYIGEEWGVFYKSGKYEGRGPFFNRGGLGRVEVMGLREGVRGGGDMDD